MSDLHHTHAHSASNRIGWAFSSNVFTIIELLGGWLTNNTAIMATRHDLGDSISIGLVWLLN
ncbi:MAG: hypothetical protein IPG64_16460 [Haliea sp.]|nr:hypothetical protein [Haliea sp.]